MNIKLLLASIMAFSMIPVLSVAPEMEIWTDGVHYRYLVKDFHVGDYIDGRVSRKQQHDIISAAQGYEAEGSFLITEDAQNYSGTNKKMQTISASSDPKTIEETVEVRQMHEGIDAKKVLGSTEVFKVRSITPIRCLSRACAMNKIRNFNAECSQAIYMYQLKDLPEKERITRQEVIDDLSESLAGAKDCALLAQEFEYLTAWIAEFKKAASSKSEDEFIEEAMSIRLPLVDVRTVQKLVEWQDIKHGFVFQGNYHIESITSYLQALGYKKIKSVRMQNSVYVPDYNKETLQEICLRMLDSALDIEKVFKTINSKKFIN